MPLRNNHIRKYSLLLLLISILSISQAESIMKSFNISQNIGGSLNYPGLLLSTNIYYRLPLVIKPGILWKTTKIDAGINNEFAPAFENPGLFIKCEPIAFFDISLYTNRVYLFKALGCGYIAMNSYSSDHENSHLRGCTQSNQQGWWFRGVPEIKLAYKNYILVNSTTLHYFFMDKKGYYLERYTNTIADEDELIIVNDLFALYQFKKFFMTGIDYSYQTVPASLEKFHRLSIIAIGTAQYSSKIDLNGVMMTGIYLNHSYYDFRDPYVAMLLQIGYRIK